MTCIAYDGRRRAMIAADSQRTDGSLILPVAARKLQHVKRDGKHLVVGLAGTPGERGELLRRFLANEVGPKLASDLLVAHLVSGGHRMFLVDVNGFPEEVTGVPFAIGTGSEFAMGAMLAGATARQAVRIAASCCSDVGGQVHAIALGKPCPGHNLRRFRTL